MMKGHVLFHIQFWQDFFARVTEKNAICFLRLVSNFNSSNSCTNRMNGNYDFHVYILIAYSYFPPLLPSVLFVVFFFHFLTFIFRFGLFVSSEPWDVWQQPSVSSSGVHFVYLFSPSAGTPGLKNCAYNGASIGIMFFLMFFCAFFFRAFSSMNRSWFTATRLCSREQTHTYFQLIRSKNSLLCHLRGYIADERRL